ncbi:MAG: NAD(P)-binding domain-containing protein [Phycisphaerales bacterium]|nr:NAD(P)-binding domain-containing protein [Phycisphaerales bacterium]
MHHDTLIIGAGPIGLETAIEFQRAQLDYYHIDAGPIGSTIFTEFPPQTTFFSSSERIAIAGMPLQTPTQGKATREEYLTYLRQVAGAFDLKVQTYTRASAAQFKDQLWHLTLTDQHMRPKSMTANHIVLATGGTAFPRTLDIPGETLSHVTHDLGDPHRFYDRRVLIIGGRNSAAEAALRCYRVGADVTISYRGPELAERVKYWLRPELDALMRSGAIKHFFNTEPTAITPDHVTLMSTSDQKEHDVPADDVLLMIGYNCDGAMFDMFGINTEEPYQAPCFDSKTMLTNAPGVYVAGTATAGTQHRFRVYIENSHVHTRRITHHLRGLPPPPDPTLLELPES